MMMTLFDDDQIMKAYTKDIREETAKEMNRDGELPLEKIAKYVPSLSMEELERLKEEVLQKA